MSGRNLRGMMGRNKGVMRTDGNGWPWFRVIARQMLSRFQIPNGRSVGLSNSGSKQNKCRRSIQSAKPRTQERNITLTHLFFFFFFISSPPCHSNSPSIHYYYHESSSPDMFSNAPTPSPTPPLCTDDLRRYHLVSWISPTGMYTPWASLIHTCTEPATCITHSRTALFFVICSVLIFPRHSI